MRKLLDGIYGILEEDFSVDIAEDLHYMCLETQKEDRKLSREYLCKLSEKIEQELLKTNDMYIANSLYKLHEEVLLSNAQDDFESYLLFVEWDREPQKKFYPPRRKVLKRVVEALQKLADDELDLLAISMPPGSGKTTLALFYLTWLAGRKPDEPMLTGSHSNSFIRGTYDECLRIMDKSGEYRWSEVFHVPLAKTNAKDCRIDLGTPKRFETFQFTSIGTGNAGLYRAMQLLYCDDLVSGLEVALSKERLDKLWDTYTTDLRQRKIGDHCKELHIATRWSVHDVIGRLERRNQNNDRAEFIVLPAVNEDGESNFDYAYGVGFSTKDYQEQKDIMDDVSWRALYMNEPIEREGQLYHPDELRRFFSLPNEEPDAILAICDTKDRGSDYCFLPVGFKYGNDHYIVDCICDNSLPNIVDARLVECLMKNKVHMARFESNSAGRRVAEDIQKEIKSRNGITHITTKFTTSNKETKIIVNSAWVKEHCIFLDESMYKKNSDYGKMMNMLCSYTMTGRNKHDDVPDGMAQYAEYAQSFEYGKVSVLNRPF